MSNSALTTTSSGERMIPMAERSRRTRRRRARGSGRCRVGQLGVHVGHARRRHAAREVAGEAETVDGEAIRRDVHPVARLPAIANPQVQVEHRGAAQAARRGAHDVRDALRHAHQHGQGGAAHQPPELQPAAVRQPQAAPLQIDAFHSDPGDDALLPPGQRLHQALDAAAPG